MGKYQAQLEKLKENMAKKSDRPDMLIALLKGLGIAFLAFTLLAGFIFTDLPLLRNVWLWATWHLFEPINRWVAEEPVTGNAIMFLFKAAGVVFILWLIRHYLMFIPTYIMAELENLSKPKKKPIQKPPVKTKPRTLNTPYS